MRAQELRVGRHAGALVLQLRAAEGSAGRVAAGAGGGSLGAPSAANSCHCGGVRGSLLVPPAQGGGAFFVKITLPFLTSPMRQGPYFNANIGVLFRDPFGSHMPGRNTQSFAQMRACTAE